MYKITEYFSNCYAHMVQFALHPILTKNCFYWCIFGAVWWETSNGLLSVGPLCVYFEIFYCALQATLLAVDCSLI